MGKHSKKKKRKKEKPTLDITLGRVLVVVTILDTVLELLDKLKK